MASQEGGVRLPMVTDRRRPPLHMALHSSPATLGAGRLCKWEGWAGDTKLQSLGASLADVGRRAQRGPGMCLGVLEAARSKLWSQEGVFPRKEESRS